MPRKGCTKVTFSPENTLYYTCVIIYKYNESCIEVGLAIKDVHMGSVWTPEKKSK